MKRRTICRSGLFVIGLLVISLIAINGSGKSADYPSSKAETHIYYPAIYNAFSDTTTTTLSITGVVRNAGVKIGAIQLELVHLVAGDESTVMTTTTQTDGTYQFLNAPGLTSGESYRVRFENGVNGDYTGYLQKFDAPEIVGPKEGVISGGNFDIAFVPLDTPHPFVITQLPATFRWSGRVYSTDDDYGLVFSDLSGTVISETAHLGYSASFSLNTLPPGMQLEKAYWWAIQVYRPDGGFGISIPRQIVFSSSAHSAGIHGMLKAKGAGLGGVELLLRHLKNGSWDTAMTTTTTTDGSYYFAGVPSLGDQEIYYVRYVNPAPLTTDYLYEWQSHTIYEYNTADPISGGIFDIENIPLIAPADKISSGLPVILQWTTRSISTAEDYEVHLYSSTLEWYSTGQKNGSSYTLSSLPDGFVYNQLYSWAIWVNNPDGGRGISRFARRITFVSP